MIMKVPASLLSALHLFTSVLASSYSRDTPEFESMPGHEKILLSPDYRTFYVRLATPNLPLHEWIPNNHGEWRIFHDTSTEIVLKYSLSSDNRTLHLLDQPILPLADPNVPPRLFAPQIRASLPNYLIPSLFEEYRGKWAMVGLDYDRITYLYPHQEPTLGFTSYSPALTINILGVGFTDHPVNAPAAPSDILLDSTYQNKVSIFLQDLNSFGRTTTNPPNNNFNFKTVKIVSRYPQGSSQQGYVHPTPRTTADCNRWSWRCADFDESPWYRYVWRQDFDGNGRIGSLRHYLLSQWHGTSSGDFSFGILVTGIVLASLIGAAIMCYGIYRGLKKGKRWWIKRWGAEEDEYNGDEELLLLSVEDDEEPPPPYVREKPLPRLPAGEEVPPYSRV
jgi:hypothetical protein